MVKIKNEPAEADETEEAEIKCPDCDKPLGVCECRDSKDDEADDDFIDDDGEIGNPEEDL